LTLLVGALTIGLILSLLALGVYISFRIFAFPDITADGSITLGAAVAAVLAVGGMNPWAAIGVVFLAGTAAGAATGILHTKFKIHGLLAGILVMTALYSINLHVMGKSNVPLLGNPVQLSPESLEDPAAFALRLHDAADPLSAYLQAQLTPGTRAALDKYVKDAEDGPTDQPAAPFPDSLARTLVNDLDDVIQGGSLFDEARFQGVELAGPTRRLLDVDPVGDQRAKLNRMLLDDAYPGLIAPYTEIRTLSTRAASWAQWLAGAYSPLLAPSEVQQPKQLLVSLRKADDPLSQYLAGRLSPETREALREYDPLTPPPPSLVEEVVADLNDAIEGPLLYDEPRFAGVELSPSTRVRAAGNPTGESLVLVNRRLIDEAYPAAIRTFSGVKQLPRLDVFGWKLDLFDAAQLAGSLLVVVGAAILLYLFFRTNLGAAMRATGDNPDMIRALGVNVENMIVFGLAISNGLIALSGAILAQYQGFADVQLGIGMIVTGLASVIIGESLVGRGGLGLTIVGTIIGSVLFRLLLAIALRWGLNPNDLKLVTALFVFVALTLPGVLAKFKTKAAVHA